MKFVSVSDVHIKAPGDKAEKLFFQFLDSKEVQQADYIFLLGDIFDLLVGTGHDVEERYSELFQKIRILLSSGKQIIQYEGNHDFHFHNLIKGLCEKWGVNTSKWQYLEKPTIFNFNDEEILFCHGDEIEIDNWGYKFYRFWIRSFPIHFLANYIVPGKWVQAIGDNASKKSRERNNDRYNENLMNKQVMPKFRESARLAARKYHASTVICGHSHCLDTYEEDKLKYYNNGYFPITHSFITGSEEGVKIITLPAAE